MKMQIEENATGFSRISYQTPYVLNNLLCMDMKVSIVDAGKRNEMKRRTMNSDFDPKVLVEHIDAFGKKLSEWKVNFISNLMDHPPKVYTPKVVEIINRIYNEKC